MGQRGKICFCYNTIRQTAEILAPNGLCQTGEETVKTMLSCICSSLTHRINICKSSIVLQRTYNH